MQYPLRPSWRPYEVNEKSKVYILCFFLLNMVWNWTSAPSDVRGYGCLSYFLLFCGEIFITYCLYDLEDCFIFYQINVIVDHLIHSCYCVWAWKINRSIAFSLHCFLQVKIDARQSKLEVDLNLDVGVNYDEDAADPLFEKKVVSTFQIRWFCDGMFGLCDGMFGVVFLAMIF